MRLTNLQEYKKYSTIDKSLILTYLIYENNFEENKESLSLPLKKLSYEEFIDKKLERSCEDIVNNYLESKKAKDKRSKNKLLLELLTISNFNALLNKDFQECFKLFVDPLECQYLFAEVQNLYFSNENKDTFLKQYRQALIKISENKNYKSFKSFLKNNDILPSMGMRIETMDFLNYLLDENGELAYISINELINGFTSFTPYVSAISFKNLVDGGDYIKIIEKEKLKSILDFESDSNIIYEIYKALSEIAVEGKKNSASGESEFYSLKATFFLDLDKFIKNYKMSGNMKNSLMDRLLP